MYLIEIHKQDVFRQKNQIDSQQLCSKFQALTKHLFFLNRGFSTRFLALNRNYLKLVETDFRKSISFYFRGSHWSISMFHRQLPYREFPRKIASPSPAYTNLDTPSDRLTNDLSQILHMLYPKISRAILVATL